MEDSTLAFLVAGVIGLIFSYVLIKAAVEAATSGIRDELRVNNSLMRKAQGISVSSVSEVMQQYENGAYTMDHAQKLKNKFNKEGKY